MNMRFEIGQNSNEFIDLSQCASIVNRRFYRQGLNWAVAGFTVYAATGVTSSFTIAKLPNTWATSNAWHKSYSAWQKQTHEAVDDAGAQSAVSRYRDFKIFASPAHVTKGFATNEVPVDFVKAAYVKGEWEASQIVIPNAAGVVGDTDEYTLHMVGGDTAGVSFGMITNYGDSRAYPQSPAPDHGNPETTYFSEMFNVGMDDSEIVQNATDKNDELPYPQTNYPGGGVQAPTLELVHKSFLNATTFHQVRKLSGTSVPCGLLNIENGTVEIPSTGPIEVIIHFVPGPDRGYLTQNMKDM